jgi:uncharacterized membrane protein HdeD (DUF308 family)
MKPSSLLILLGVVLLVGGVLAIADPFAATLAVTTLVGILLAVAGVGQLWAAFAGGDLPHRLWTGLIGALGLVVGIDLIANPLEGMVSLTLLAGVLFLLTGAIRLWVAFRLREAPQFWPILISGAASVLIGSMIFADILAAATTLLGLLLGIQLLADGVGLLALGLFARRL